MADQEGRFEGVEEVAERLLVDQQTVRRWIKAGKLKAYKLGREYRIKSTDLEEFLETREVGPKAPTPSSPLLPEEAEDERRDLRAWFSLGLVTEYLESLYTRFDELVRNAPNHPDLQEYRGFKARLEDHFTDFLEMQRSVRSRQRIVDFLLRYDQDIQEGKAIPPDIRDVIAAYHEAKNSINEDAIPRAGKWILEHGERLNLEEEAQESPLLQDAA